LLTARPARDLFQATTAGYWPYVTDDPLAELWTVLPVTHSGGSGSGLVIGPEGGSDKEGDSEAPGSLDGYARAASGDVIGWIFRSYDEEAGGVGGRHAVAGRNPRHGTEAVRGDGRALADFDRGIRPTHERDSQGRLLHDDEARRLGADAGRQRRRGGGDRSSRREPGKDILVHGGPTFVQSLSKLDLIDEYRLIVHPVVLAGGLPLFDRTIALKLMETRPFPAGAVALIYGRA
jgi:hypothetical protein